MVFKVLTVTLAPMPPSMDYMQEQVDLDQDMVVVDTLVYRRYLCNWCWNWKRPWNWKRWRWSNAGASAGSGYSPTSRTAVQGTLHGNFNGGNGTQGGIHQAGGGGGAGGAAGPGPGGGEGGVGVQIPIGGTNYYWGGGGGGGKKSAIAMVVVQAASAVAVAVDRKAMVADLEEDLLLMMVLLQVVILLVDMRVRTVVEAAAVDRMETSMAVMVLLVLLSSHTQPDK